MNLWQAARFTKLIAVDITLRKCQLRDSSFMFILQKNSRNYDTCSSLSPGNRVKFTWQFSPQVRALSFIFLLCLASHFHKACTYLTHFQSFTSSHICLKLPSRLTSYWHGKTDRRQHNKNSRQHNHLSLVSLATQTKSFLWYNFQLKLDKKNTLILQLQIKKKALSFISVLCCL